MMDECNSGCFRFHWLQIKRQINLEVMHSFNTRVMKAAYKQADGKKLYNRRVLVDVERGRTVPNWWPRRLGSGLGTTRIGGKDLNQKHSWRERESSHERGREREWEKSCERSHDRPRDRDQVQEKGNKQTNCTNNANLIYATGALLQLI
ncbi:U1 small nuclear ribonucleoprotein 70 kDa-like [Rhododendron vialii]|uniref:U1 small nuclear ribonucleoprotein 70 kDa-like n=1 Tax=Rhododendron vialii TaxID=182163 RepID=UPI00265E7A26|nr:U1 small nuclear ribonucleoprotein 70 kDa-like [Rhododendron vialii]